MEVRYRPWLIWLMIFGDLAFSCGFIWVLALDETESMSWRIAGAVFGLIFLSQGYLFLREITSQGPALVINSIGISSRRIGPDPIPWSAIERIIVSKIKYSRHLQIIGAEIKKYNRPKYLSVRLIRAIDPEMYLGSLSLYLDGMDITNDEVISAVKQHKPEVLDLE